MRLSPRNPRVTQMSPTTDNFIHSLVEMSKAFEELPGVRAEADERARQNDILAQQVQQREESILKLKAELEAKNETIRKVEAERDDAEMRFLELDDKVAMVNRNAASLQEILAKQIELTTPPKPEPQPEPEQPKAIDNPMYGDPDRYAMEAKPIPEVVHNLDPITARTPDLQPSGVADTLASTASTAANPSTEGQRAPLDPTVSSEVGDGASQGSAPRDPVKSQADAGSQETSSSILPSDPTKPYTDKRWAEVHPRVWNKDEWLTGGGTEEGWHSNG